MTESIARPWRGSVPLNPRTALSDLIARVFSAPFAKVFSSPIASPGAVAAIPWYLSGGIAAANCIAAYQPKGAASLAASYANLPNPGTYNAVPLDAITVLNAYGWYWNDYNIVICSLKAGIDASTMITVVVRYKTWENVFALFGAQSSAGNIFGIGMHGQGYIGNSYPTFTPTPVGTDNCMIICRTNRRLYYNGLKIQSSGNAETSWGSFGIRGCPNYNDDTNGYPWRPGGGVAAWVAFNTDITDDQAAALYTNIMIL